MSGKTFREKVFKKFGDQCSAPRCSKDADIVHHVDGDNDNDKVENGRPFCNQHHEKLHIKGNGVLSEWTKKLPKRSLFGVDRHNSIGKKHEIGLENSDVVLVRSNDKSRFLTPKRKACLLGMKNQSLVYWRINDGSIVLVNKEGEREYEDEVDSIRTYLLQERQENVFTFTQLGYFLGSTASYDDSTVLPEREAKAYALFRFTDLGRDDVAERLGVSVHTVDNQRRKVKTKIKVAHHIGAVMDKIEYLTNEK